MYLFIIMVSLNLFKVLRRDLTSLPSSYEFKLKVNINVGWLHLLKLGYLLVLAVIFFIIYMTGGWNYKESGMSSLVIKVKGADFSENEVWDSVDYVYPPQEVKAFLITTKAAITKQVQSECPDNNESSRCSKDSDCKIKRRTENGIKTGKCDKKSKMCLINAWCPVENIQSNYTKIHYINGAPNFTVYVRDHEEFIKFNISKSNDPYSIKSSKNCLFNVITDPTCPIFKIADILNATNVKFKDIKIQGGVFQFYIKWHCYFNWNSRNCTPKYSFKRIAKDNTGKFAGYRMRYSIYQEINGTKKRTLTTVNGLRFLIMIKSIGEQFKIITFLSNLGSYLSYFAIWTFITGVLCAIFLVDKNDLLTIDESVMKKLVRNHDDEEKHFNTSEMKVLTKEEVSNDQKIALVSNC